MNARPEWQERLEEPETVSPPEDLLPRLIEDIPGPAELRTSARVEDGADSRAGSKAGSRPSRRGWLVAATLVIASVPVYRFWQERIDESPRPAAMIVISDPRDQAPVGSDQVIAGPQVAPRPLPAPDTGRIAPPPHPNESTPEPEPAAQSALGRRASGELVPSLGLDGEKDVAFDNAFDWSETPVRSPEPNPGDAFPSERLTVTSEAPAFREYRASSGLKLELRAGRRSERAPRYDYDLAPSVPDTMIFDRERPHRFVDPADEPLSTFGLDVDTGSYTLGRRYLLDVGTLPPAESIRIEEWINYFDYDDPSPERNEDFSVTVEGAPSPYASSSRRYLVRIGIKAREVKPRKREPVSLVFLVDVSGSMARENRLELVKRSLELLLEELSEDDRVGLVVYSSNARAILEPTSDRERVMRAIERLQPEQSTNLEAGMELAYAMAERHARLGAVSRIVLCSDGVANVGSTDPVALLRSVAASAEAGIELATVGFGMGNYNDALMEQLANRGDGSYAYVDTLDEAKRVFVDNLTGMLHTVASDARVQVEFNQDAVVRYRQLGYENRELPPEAFRDPDTDAGEIGAGHAISVLYEIELLRGASDVDRLAELRLRYRSKETRRFEETAVEIRRRDLARSWRRAKSRLKLAGAVASVADQLRQVERSDLRSLSRRELEEMSHVVGLAERELGQLDGFGDEKVEELEDMVRLIHRRIRVALD